MKYIVGDIHGEVHKLKNLIDNICARDSTPSFIFIGDYIDKGHDSKETLLFLHQIEKYYDCIFLIGNHEYIWMNFSLENRIDEYKKYLLKYGGINTNESFGETDFVVTQKKILSDFENFFLNLKSYCIINNYFVCHSGIPPVKYNISPEDIPAEDFLFNRYDFITNGNLYYGKYKVVFGHTAFYTPYVDAYKIGIDTGACYFENAPLTAFCTEESFFINSCNTYIQIDDIPTNVCPNIIRAKPYKQ